MRSNNPDSPEESEKSIHWGVIVFVAIILVVGGWFIFGVGGVGNYAITHHPA